MLKIGYVDARCPSCGEKYNGYGFHSCPQTLDLAQEKVLRAAEDWVAQFLECPRTKVDAILFNAMLEYLRSKEAETERGKLKALSVSFYKKKLPAFKQAHVDACLPKRTKRRKGKKP